MKVVKLLIPILFTLFLTSCSETYEVIDNSKLGTAFIINSSATFKGYYYQGTDSEFHYFISKWTFVKDKYFKLKKGDLNIDSPYDFQMKELRVDLFENDKNFGRNEYYELYIMD